MERQIGPVLGRGARGPWEPRPRSLRQGLIPKGEPRGPPAELAAALRLPGGSGRSRGQPPHSAWIYQGPVSSLSIASSSL